MGTALLHGWVVMKWRRNNIKPNEQSIMWWEFKDWWVEVGTQRIRERKKEIRQEMEMEEKKKKIIQETKDKVNTQKRN